ncbi:endolytic transglycosylase MltG [Cryptosporangium phraense]|uniref:endolytic transglycosylase MltG n=1 Tax=Cryptosporangium phraense TaxID=2593070 RepID=UPI0014790A90|nr:endolytic transglycosylase MltG [Cryptosporangium phraense]
MALLVVVAVLGGLAFGGWYGVTKVKDFFTADDYDGPGSGSVDVTIEDDQTVTAIGNTLYSKQVIASAKAFVNAAADNPDSTTGLQPGTYRLKKRMKASDALVMLLDRANRVSGPFVIIPEGLTVKEILPLLAKKSGIPLADFQAAAKDPAALGVPEWGGPSPSKRVLEGFLYPSRYEFDDKSTAEGVLKQMVALSVQAATKDDLAGKAQELGVSEWDLMIIASLIEQEGINDDFGKISRVIYNRLNSTGALSYLQFDSTTQYWLIQTGKGRKNIVTDAELKDPDNNYSTDVDRHQGLPPTPIGNPGDAALKAAANPTPGNWTYFVVVTEDRHSAFTDDYNVHQQNIIKCRAVGRC